MIVRAAIRPVPAPGALAWAASIAACTPAVLIGVVASWCVLMRNFPVTWKTPITLAIIFAAWIGPLLHMLGLIRRQRRLLEVGGLLTTLVAFGLSVLGLFIAGGTQSLVTLVIAAGMFVTMMLATVATGDLAETWRDLEGRAVPPDRARRWETPGGGGPNPR